MPAAIIATPLGSLVAVASSGVLTELRFARAGTGKRDDAAGGDAVLAVLSDQLAAYFAGRLREFDLPLAPHGSAFEQRVWALLRNIPYGETTSYGDVARRLEMPNAARAVGLANGRNPIVILIPCHRVIGADGRLTGYGGGLTRKRTLLALESRHSGLFAPASTL